MRNSMTLVLVTVALATSAAAVPGVRPLTHSRITRAWTGIRESGQTYIAEREMQVDLDFPLGKTFKGTLFILFEPSSGLFLQTFDRETPYQRKSWADDFLADARVGVMPDRLVIMSAGGGVAIDESTEKAGSLDEAEAKSLKWLSDHLMDIEAGKPSRPVRRTVFEMPWYPEGFCRGVGDARGGLSMNLVDMVPYPNGWELTLECTDTRQKSKLMVLRQGEIPAWVITKPARID